MIPVKPSYLLVPLVSFALAAALTPVVRRLARRWGFVAKPKTDRWHKRPTAMMGGGCDLAGGNHDLPDAGSAHERGMGRRRRRVIPFFWLD